MMAVYRKTATKPLPENAEISVRKNERFARWKDRRGKTRTAKVTTGRNGADRIVIQTATFTAKYRDGQGVVREVATGCRTRDGALSVERDLVARSEKVKAGILTPEEDRIGDHQVTLLSNHIDAYIDHQNTKGLNKARIDSTRSRLEGVADDCEWKRLADLNASKLERWLVDRQQEGAREEDGMSAGNRNEYRGAWVGFGNWCVKTGRLLNNPLADVPRADAKADCRRKRRALTEDELARLLDAARRRPLHDAMTVRTGPNKGKQLARVSDKRRIELERLGRERALIYKTYLLTGLRKGELASLTVGQLHLDGAMPYVELDAADEKNRRGADIPLRGDLADELRQWLVEKLVTRRPETLVMGEAVPTELPSDTPLFDVPSGLLRILDRDLAFAGIPKKDDRGRTVDVHALRHTFGTHLSVAGVAPRTAQAAMRHSSIDLTMNVYTDPRLLDVHGALDKLPELSLDTPTHDMQEAKATGTCDESPRKFAPGFAPKSGNASKSVSSTVTLTDSAETAGAKENPEKLSVSQGLSEWSGRDLNPRPLHCERSALPTELPPRVRKVTIVNVVKTLSSNRTSRPNANRYAQSPAARKKYSKYASRRAGTVVTGRVGQREPARKASLLRMALSSPP